MCRLLAYAAPRDTTVTKVVGSMNSDAFQRMTSVHSDGWGTAWLAQGPGEDAPEIESLRISTPGQHDPVLSALLRESPSSARLVHLRLATDDFKRTKVNTHPFVGDGIAFAHNGSIVPTHKFASVLDAESFAGVQGDTDSELYFALVRQNLRRLGSLRQAVVETVHTLRELFPTASLNAVLLTADELVVVHASSTASVTAETFARYGIDAEDLPDGHVDAYYRLSMLRSADGTTVFASTGIDTSGWTVVPDDTVTHVDLATLDLSQRALFPAAARGTSADAGDGAQPVAATATAGAAVMDAIAAADAVDAWRTTRERGSVWVAPVRDTGRSLDPFVDGRPLPAPVDLASRRRRAV